MKSVYNVCAVRFRSERLNQHLEKQSPPFYNLSNVGWVFDCLSRYQIRLANRFLVLIKGTAVSFCRSFVGGFMTSWEKFFFGVSRLSIDTCFFSFSIDLSRLWLHLKLKLQLYQYSKARQDKATLSHGEINDIADTHWSPYIFDSNDFFLKFWPRFPRRIV